MILQNNRLKFCYHIYLIFQELKYIGSITSKVFLIFPQFCLGQGLMNMASLHVSSRLLSQFGNFLL